MKNLNAEYLQDVILVDEGETLRLVISSDEKCRSCAVATDGERYAEAHNVIEPFDFFTHVFYLPKSSFDSARSASFTVENMEEDSEYFEAVGELGEVDILIDPSRTVRPDDLLKSCDSGIEIKEKKDLSICDGADYSLIECVDKKGLPVKLFALFADPEKVSFYCGTPNDGMDYVDRKQTVEGEALAAIQNGVPVIAATNADFFDMFGDCRPSGLCVKNGVVIANGDSSRPYFAVTKEGKPVISCLNEGRFRTDELFQAVSGLPIILKDGQITECMPAEPFGNIRHPRTCVGICPDGKVIVLIIDGRIPKYSNGATLMDAARLMQKLGAETALNLDGGGSCTFLIREGDGFSLKNNPADLFRPTEKLIRDVFDTLLIIKKV